MGNDEDAKDMLQDSFIDAFMKIGSLKDPETFPAWIKRITVNHCINAIKKRKRSLYEEAPEEVVEMNDFEEPWSGRKEDQTILIRKVMHALDRISDGCKTVFNLYLFEGYDHKEIGEILSITESASKAQYSKAKMKIRKLLSEQQL